jgi:hypothetical protein
MKILGVRWTIEALIERDDEWEAEMIRNLFSESDWYMEQRSMKANELLEKADR